MGELFRSRVDDEVMRGLMAPFHKGELSVWEGISSGFDLGCFLHLRLFLEFWLILSLRAKSPVGSDGRNIRCWADVVGAGVVLGLGDC